MHMSVGVVLLNYNDYETTIESIERLKSCKEIDKIVVVDNHSTDGSYEKLAKYKSDYIDLLETNENLGYATGNNVGIHHLIQNYGVEYLIIANPDVEFGDEHITAMKHVYENAMGKVGVVAPRMKSLTPEEAKTSWRLPTFRDKVFSNFILLKIMFGDPIAYPKEKFQGKITQVDAILGALFMMKAATMQEVNYFDEDTFLYEEENILAFKLKEKGYVNYLINDIAYLHGQSVSIKKSIASFNKRIRILHESNKIYNRKYLRTSKLQDFLFQASYIMGTKLLFFVIYLKQ